MGKTTRYHPISLNVLRGSAEFCGVKLVHIRQIVSDHSAGEAAYSVECTFPRLCAQNGCTDEQLSAAVVKETLHNCFMEDVRVMVCGWSSKKGWWATLRTVASDQAEGQ